MFSSSLFIPLPEILQVQEPRVDHLIQVHHPCQLYQVNLVDQPVPVTLSDQFLLFHHVVLETLVVQVDQVLLVALVVLVGPS